MKDASDSEHSTFKAEGNTNNLFDNILGKLNDQSSQSDLDQMAQLGANNLLQ
jgi:hypothetical protein